MANIHILGVIVGKCLSFVEGPILIPHNFEPIPDASIISKTKQGIILIMRRHITNSILKSLIIPLNKLQILLIPQRFDILVNVRK
jgi:hypothetical protein